MLQLPCREMPSALSTEEEQKLEQNHSGVEQNYVIGASLPRDRLERDAKTLTFSGVMQLTPASRNKCKGPVVVILVTLLVLIVIVLVAVLGVEKSKKPPLCPPAVSWCLDGWFRRRGKCYYFSKAEGNWTESQNFCSSHAASLARIESLQELDSLLPYRGRLNHWIGLRKDPVGIWRWVNGTEFDHRFGTGGAADCALLDEDLDISSSDCNMLRKWLCT